MGKVRKGKKPSMGGHGQAWLAGKLGISQQRVSSLIRGDGWPFSREKWAEADIPAIQAHMAVRRAENNATGDESDPLSEIRNLSPFKQAQLRLVVERAASLKVGREMKLGGYLKKEDVERGRVERVYAVRAALANIRLLALKTEGMNLQEREVVLEDFARSLCRKFEHGDE